MTRKARAIALLTAAGYSSAYPLRLSITYNTADTHKKIATLIAGMWR